MTLFKSTGEIIGTTQSVEPICDVKKGKNYELSFEMDISNIQPDSYYFIIDLYSSYNEYSYRSYDHPLKAIVFSVADSQNRGIKWENQYFGNIMLNDVHCNNIQLS